MRRLAVILFLALAAPAAAQFAFLGISNSLVDFVLDQISVPGELELTAESVEEAEDGALDIVGLTVADGQGVWMSVERLSIRWNAGRILRGELEIGRLEAEGVDVARAPNATAVDVEVKEGSALAEEGGALFDWPRSPITTRVERLALTRVTIAPGVIAAPGLAFDAEGSARDEGDEQAVALTVLRTDDVAGRILVDFLRDFAANSLKLTLEAEEEAGGLVAALADFPPDAASLVTLSGRGPLDDWALDFEARADDVFDAAGTARVQAVGPLAVTASFRLAPGASLDPALQAALAPEARLDIDVAEDDGGVIRIRQGALTARDLDLVASGAFNKTTTESDLTIRLDARAGLADLVEGVDFERFGFDGAVAGPFDDLSAEGRITLAALRTAPVDVAAADLAATVTIKGQDIAARLSGGAAGLRLDRLGPELLGAAEIAVDAAYDGQIARLAEMRITAKPLVLSAQGEADVAGETATLSYTLAAPELGPLATAYEIDARGALDASGQVAGPFAAPRLTGRMALDDLFFEDEPYGAVALTHDVVIDETPSGAATLRATGSRFGLVSFDGGFRLSGSQLSLTDMIATGLSARIAGALEIDLAETLIDGAVDLSAPDLAPIGAALGTPIAGGAAGQVTLSTEAGRQDADVDLALTAIDGFDARLAEARLDATIRDALGAPAFDGLLTARGATGLGYGVETLRFEGVGAALTSDDPSFDGAFSATGLVFAEGAVAAAEGSAKGALSAFEVDAKARGVEAAGAKIAAAAVKGRVTGAATDAPEANLTLTAEGLAAAGAKIASLQADVVGGLAELTLDARARGVAAAGATIAAATVKGKVSEPVSEAVSADLTLTASGLAAAGAEIAALTAKLNGGLARATLGATAEGISAGDVTVARLRLDGSGRDLAAADPGIEAKAVAETIAAPGATVATAEVTATGRLSALNAAVEVEGALADEGGPLQLSAAARADLTGATQRATVSKLTLTAGDAALSLRQPLAIAIAPGVTRFADIDLALPGGGLTGDAALYASGATGDVALRLSDLTPLAKIADLPIERGALDMTARFDTRRGSAGAAVQLDVAEMRFADIVADIGALGLTGALNWDGRRAVADAALSGPFGDPIAVSAALPLRPSGGPVPTLPQDGALSGAVRWAGDIGELWALVPAPGHVLDGATRVDFTLGGTLAAPTVGGDVAITDGRYENLDIGAILVDLNLASRVAPDGAFAIDLTAHDGADQPVTAVVSLADGQVDAKVEASGATLVRRDDATAAISLDITAKGPLTGPRISGRIGVDRAEIRLVAATPPGVADLGPVRIKGAPPVKEEPAAGGDVTLDLKIEGPQDIFVRGRGLDSEWKIDLAVTGTAASPRILGAIEKRRGFLTLLGAPLDLARGEVRFFGRPEPDPTLDILLEREKDGVTGGIAVTGTGSEPEITFVSRPALPEDEVLPRILFGQSSQSLSPSQALSMAIGVATLLDGTGGAADGVRGAVGVDVLRVEDGEDGPSVTVGSNVADGVYVGVKQPIGGGSASVQVEVEVFDDFTIDSETGADTGTSFGLNWKRDF